MFSSAVSIEEGGIPSGGYAGELMVVVAYGFPIEVLSVVMIIGTLVEPILALLNATGDTTTTMVVATFIEREQ